MNSLPPYEDQTGRSRARFVLVIIPAILLVGMPAGAYAQVIEPPASPTLAEPTAEEPGEQGDGDHFMIGVGAAYMPVHHGSDDYRIQPLPAIDIKWGRFFANFQNGVGLNLIDSEHVTIGAGLVPVDGYRRKDVPDGVGKLSMGLGGRGFISLRQLGFEATVGATKVITGSTEGFLVDASLSYPVPVGERLMLVPSIGATWADRKHNNRYFGITPQQSAASGLPEFRVGSGLLDAKAELGIQYRLTERISAGLSGGVTTLLGDVKDSPIVESKTRPFGVFFVGYRF